MRMLRRGRRVAESLMTDTVKGVVPGGEVWDETAGQYVPSETTIYEGPARFRLASASGRVVDDAAALVTVQQLTMSLPIDSTAEVPIGAVFTITASDTDAGNVGARFRVKAVHPQTHSTARRFQVEHYQQGVQS